MKLNQIRTARNLAKIVLALGLVLLSLLGGYSLYNSFTNKPVKVRVTNITANSATISWYTNSPTEGVVYYSDNDSDLMFPLKFIRAQKAYDDRDWAKAQKELVERINSKAVEKGDEYLVDVNTEEYSDVVVKKTGDYYTHHITLRNLDEEKAYYFRVGDSIVSWSIESALQETGDLEMPAVDEFSFSTFSTPSTIPTPNPAYGKVLATTKNEDGYIGESDSKDSIIYAVLSKADGSEHTEYISAVTNEEGGWYIDKANARSSEGVLAEGYANAKDYLVLYVQYENVERYGLRGFLLGSEDSPTYDIPGNMVEDINEVKNIFKGFTAKDFVDRMVLSAASRVYAREIVSDDDGILVTYSSQANSGEGRYYVTSSTSSSAPEKNDTDNDDIPNPGSTDQDSIIEYINSAEERMEKSSAVVEGCVSNAQCDENHFCVNGTCTGTVAGTSSVGAKDDKQICVGSLSRGCFADADNACYCQWVYASNPDVPSGAGYSRISGDSTCIPRGCYANEESLASVGFSLVNGTACKLPAEGVCKGEPIPGCLNTSGKAVVADKDYGKVAGECITEPSKVIDGIEVWGTHALCTAAGYKLGSCEYSVCVGKYSSKAICGSGSAETEYSWGLPWSVIDAQASLGSARRRVYVYNEASKCRIQYPDTHSCEYQLCMGVERERIPQCSNEEDNLGSISFEERTEYTFELLGSSLSVGRSYTSLINIAIERCNVPENRIPRINAGREVEIFLNDEQRKCMNEELSKPGTQIVANDWEAGSETAKYLGENEYIYVESLGSYILSDDYYRYKTFFENIEERRILFDKDNEGERILDIATVQQLYTLYNYEEASPERIIGSNYNIHYNPTSSMDVSLIESVVCLADDPDFCVIGMLPEDKEKAISYVRDTLQLDDIPADWEVTQQGKAEDHVICTGDKKCIANYKGTSTSLDGKQICTITAYLPFEDSRIVYEYKSEGITLTYVAESERLSRNKFTGTTEEAIEKAIANAECKDIEGISDSSVQGVTDTLVNKAYAEETSNIAKFPTQGLYNITVGGKTMKVLSTGENEILLYTEKNNKEGYQVGEDELVDIDPSAVKRIADVYQYPVVEGINMLSFPFLPLNTEKETLMASELLSLINQYGLKVSQITYFDNGKWDGGLKVLSVTENVYAGNDFPIFPGKGYLIVAELDSTIQITGLELMSPMPVELGSGWNFVGINGYSTFYTADSLIDDFNSVEGVTVDNITWWPRDLGKYEGFQKTNSIKYGLDYPISNRLGYFVKVSSYTSTDCKSLLWNPGGDMNGKCGRN